MLVTNETFSLLAVRFFLTIDKQMRCIVNKRLWLLIHFIVTLLIHSVFAFIYIFLLMLFTVLVLCSPCFRNAVRTIQRNIRLGSFQLEDRYFYGIALVLKEIIMTLVYVLSSFLYKWFELASNDSPLTSMNFRRWLVEASSAPFLFSAFVLEYYIGFNNIIFDEWQSVYIVTVALKVPLFFLMRWAENQPDFFLNNLESLLISELCKSISK